MRDSCLETCRHPSFFPYETWKPSGPRLFAWNQCHPITAFSPCLRQKGTQQMQKKDQITQDADYQTALLEYRQAHQHY